MQKLGKQKLMQAMACYACTHVALMNTKPVEGTEFSGGMLTGPLLLMVDIGSLLLMVALVVTVWHPRIAAAIALVCSLLCLPLYLYFVAPGPFRWAFPGEYSVPLQSDFVCDQWAIAGLLAAVIAGYIFLRTFSIAKREPSEATDESRAAS